MKKAIIFTDKLNLSKSQRETLEQNESIRLQYKKAAELTAQDFDETEIVIGNCDAKILKNFKHLKWMQLQSAGTDAYVKEGILPDGVTLTNATGTYGTIIAEYLLGTTIILQRDFHRYLANQQQQVWQNEGKIQSIHNSVFLIIGLGDIGTEFAKRVQTLGGYTIGVKRTIYGDEKCVDEVYTIDDLDKLIERADAVAMSVPGTADTAKLWNADRISKMKESAIFMNVGRGISVDTDALCDALEKKQIRGAALDVFEIEPLPKGHRAWTTPNLIITPHISGTLDLEETQNRFVQIVKENMDRYVRGLPFKTEVDLKLGYRKKQ